MLLLPAQTSRTCRHRGCSRRATARVTLNLYLHGELHMPGDPKDKCALHAEKACTEDWGVSRAELVVEPLPPFCSICGCDEAKGECTQLGWAKALLVEPFQCGCVVCTVYGGDCANVAARDAAWDVLKVHGVSHDEIVAERDAARNTVTQEGTMDLDTLRLPNGDYRPYTEDTHQPIAYIVADGEKLCAACANGGNGSRAAEKLDPECPDDDQWRIIGADSQENADEEVRCAHCNTIIAFAAK